MDNTRVVGITAIVSLIIATVSLVLSWRDQDRSIDEGELAQVEKKIYQRILNEVWQEIKPVYEDFHIKVQPTPTSFREMMNPLISVKPLVTSLPTVP